MELLLNNTVHRLLNLGRLLHNKPRTPNNRPTLLTLVMGNPLRRLSKLRTGSNRHTINNLLTPVTANLLPSNMDRLPNMGSLFRNNMARRIPLRRPMSHPRRRASDTERRNRSTGMPTQTRTLFGLQ